MRYPVKTSRAPESIRTGTWTLTSRYDVLRTSYISSFRWMRAAPRSKKALTDSYGLSSATVVTLRARWSGRGQGGPGRRRQAEAAPVDVGRVTRRLHGARH